MKYLTLFLLSAVAQAQDYKCLAPANPELGFNYDTYVSVDPKIGGQIIAQQDDLVLPVAIIAEVKDMRDPSSMAFKLVLKYFGESQLSGLSNPERVTRIVRYINKPWDRPETSVLRYFEGARQVGGTFLLRGDPIACLP